MDIAVSDGMLYWTERDHENVFSMPAAGGVTTTIVIADKNPEKIAAVGRDVFWVSSAVVLRHAWSSTNADDVTVSAMPIGGLDPSPDGRTVYYSAGAFVWPVPTTGEVRVVAQEDRPGALRALTLVGDGLAWLDVNGNIDYAPIVDGQVARCGFQNADGTLDQTTCARLVRDRVSLLPEVILHAPGAVIWANGENIETKAIPSSLPETASRFETITSTHLGTVSGMAISTTHVYFAASDPMMGVGTIEKAPIAPDQVPIRIARGQNGPRALAVGDTKVYWSTADCTIESQDL